MARRREKRCVASFNSTHEALKAEKTCRELGISGRIIPTPVAIRADCGLAWSMPPEVRDAFEGASMGNFVYAGIYELEL